MPTNSRLAGFVFALAATILWSGNFVLARGVAHAIPPIQLNFWRWFVALLCVLPLALPKLRADWPDIRRHWRYFAGMALVGVSILNAMIYKAGQSTSSLNMALLAPTAPVMIIILSRIFYGEPVTYKRLGGVAVVLGGILELISRGDWRHIAEVNFTPGDLWTLGGAASFAVYSLFTKDRPAKVSVEGFNVALYAVGLLLLLPALAWEAAVRPAPVWNAQVITAVLYAGVGCSFAAYMLWTKAIAIVGPVLSGIVYYSLPLFTAVESVLILGEDVAMYHVTGGGLIISGILIATVDRKTLKQKGRTGR